MNKIKCGLLKCGSPFFFLLLIQFQAAFSFGQAETGEGIFPKVYLNHFFLVIDSATYKDIAESDFIKNEFAVFQEKTSVSNNLSWTGLYVNGENTYFELFNTMNSPFSRQLSSGIAFSVECKDESKIVFQKLKAYKNTLFFLRKREHGGDQIPWFYTVTVLYGESDSPLMTWVMEYHEDYLKNAYPEFVSPSTEITRREYLETITAGLKKADRGKNRLFKDVIEVNLLLNRHDSEKVKGELAVFGYEIVTEGVKAVCKGPDVLFVINTVDGASRGIASIKMSLHHGLYEKTTYRFGEKSRMILHEDKTATWIFH